MLSAIKNEGCMLLYFFNQYHSNMLKSPIMSSQRQSTALLLVLGAILLCLVDYSSAVKIRGGADPTIMKIGDTYYSAESSGGIYVRAASSLEGLGAPDVRRVKVWSDTIGDVWAPEITTDLGRTFIHFSAGKDAAHRMYVISADSPLDSYSAEEKLALPDDQVCIFSHILPTQ